VTGAPTAKPTDSAKKPSVGALGQNAAGKTIPKKEEVQKAVQKAVQDFKPVDKAEESREGLDGPIQRFQMKPR
jgi:hypothetical protein